MPQITPPPIKSAKGLTQKQKIIALMCQQPAKWFYAHDFMKPQLGHMFVGYKAETRLRELHLDYPQMFERARDGKYIKRRINAADITTWYDTLKPELRQIVGQYLKVGDLTS